MKILFKIMMLNLFLVPCYAQDEKNIVLRKMQYSSDPLPESKGGYLVRNQNFVHGTLQFQQKYGPAMIYWEKEKSKLEADFIYLRYSTDIGGLVLKTSCKEFKYNDKIYYLLSGHTNSPTDLYRVAFAIVEPLSTPKSLKRLEKLTGDEALVSYYTHPSFYDKNKTEDFQGCKIPIKFNIFEDGTNS